MKKLTWITGSVVAGTLLIASSVYACGGPGEMGFGGHKGKGDPVMHMVKRLDLDETQRDTIQKIMDEQRDAKDASRKTGDENRKALREAAMSETYDAAKVKALADSVAQDMSNMIVQRTETMHRIRGLLNEEQLKELEEHQEKRYDRGHRS